MEVYSYFYIYTVRIEELKEFCDFVFINYKQILGYSKTRWLALMPVVEMIPDMYQGLKSYFLDRSVQCFWNVFSKINFRKYS